MKNSKITLKRDYDGLTQRDIDNLNFLITASKDTIRQWMQVVDSDDIGYALDLMSMYNLRMLDRMADDSDLAEAREMLAKIGISTSKTDPNDTNVA